MNLFDLVREVGELPGRSQRTDQDVKRFINRAIRAIANRKNWSFLHDNRPYVILTGDTSVSMGPDFKCLSTEESPISVSYEAGNMTYRLPCRVLSREEVERQLFWPWIGQFLNQPVPGGYVPIRVVFMERDSTGGQGGVWRLHIPPQFNVQSNSPYNVSAFYFPKPLIHPDDTNAITEDPDLADAVVNYAKSLKYSAENEMDSRAKMCLAAYEEHFTQADYSDELIKYAGRSLRM
jgi:hypothetical protein